MKTELQNVAEAGGAILLSNLKDQFVGGYASPLADAVMALISHSAVKGTNGNTAAAFFGARAVTNTIKRVMVKNPSSMVGRLLPGEIGGGLFQLKIGASGTNGISGLLGMGNDDFMMEEDFMTEEDLDQLGNFEEVDFLV